MKWIKIAGIVFTSFMVAAIILTAIFISPITKYLIETNSKAFMGRKVCMDGLFINFFSGSMSITDLQVFEPDDADVFFYCHKISSNITVKKLLQGEYEINEMTFIQPEIKIYQDGNTFSFDDITAHFASTDTTTKADAAAPLKYRIRNIMIDSGQIQYINIPIKDTTALLNLDFTCPQFVWDDSNTQFITSFAMGSGGNLNADLKLNIASLDFALLLGIEKLNLRKYYKPLASVLHAGGLNGFLDAGIASKGNFNELGAVAASGKISLSELAIKDTTGADFTSFRSFEIQVDSLNIKENIYDFHKISLDQPYFKFDLYANGNNISAMLVESGTASTTDTTAATSDIDYSNVFTLMGSYVRSVSSNYIVSNYSADSILLRNGHVIYNDYTLNDRFTYDLDSINMHSGKINSAGDSIILRMDALLNYSGDFNAYVASTPDFKTMRINYSVQDMKVTDFNAYSRHYVATPFFDGVLDYESTNLIVDGKLKSSNIIFIEELTAGKKVEKKPLYDVPVRLAVSLLKDVHGDIKLDIPVEGDLNDPEYKIGKVIWQIVENILIKAVTAPFNLLAGLFSSNEEDMKEIPFNYLQPAPEQQQFKQLDMVAHVLENKKELQVELLQLSDTFMEKELMALTEAKKQYYLSSQGKSGDSLTTEEWNVVEAIETRDTLFNHYLDERLQLSSDDLASTQEKCISLTGDAALKQQVQALMEQRNTGIRNYLVNTRGLAAERILIGNNHDVQKSNGLSQPRYLVSYGVEE